MSTAHQLRNLIRKLAPALVETQIEGRDFHGPRWRGSWSEIFLLASQVLKEGAACRVCNGPLAPYCLEHGSLGISEATRSILSRGAMI